MADHKVINWRLYNDALTDGCRLLKPPPLRLHVSTLVVWSLIWLLAITPCPVMSAAAVGASVMAAGPSITQLTGGSSSGRSGDGSASSSSSGIAQLGLGEWHPSVQTCQPVEKLAGDLCADLPYNYTTMPNFVGHSELGDAVASLESYRLLIRSPCSAQIRFFVCAVHLPMCTPIAHTDSIVVIPPCRHLCLEVREQCEPVLQAFNYTWPTQFNCDAFPEANKDDQMCMPGENAPEPTTPPPELPDGMPTQFNVTFPSLNGRSRAHCSQPENAYFFLNSTNRCVLNCAHNFLTSKEEKASTEVLHGVVAGLAFLGAVIVATLFSCGRRRTTEQEKPIFMILLCFVFMATGYAVRLAGERKMGCLSTVLPDGQAVSYLVASGMEIPGPSCVAVFVLLFYFGLAANIWWVVLTVVWYYAAVRERKTDTIRSVVKKFHLFAWSVPAVLTGIGIAGKFLDTDELTAMCSIGQQNNGHLIIFVVTPQVAVTLSGAAVLLIGYLQLTRRRRFLAAKNAAIFSQSETLKQARDEKLFGLCLLFLPSTLIVIGCHVAQLVNNEIRPPNSPDPLRTPLYFVRLVMQFIYFLMLIMWFCLVTRRRVPGKSGTPPTAAGRYSGQGGLKSQAPIFVAPPLPGTLKLMENSYAGIRENSYEAARSDMYNSAVTGPYSPSPSLATSSSSQPYPKSGSRYERRLINQMMQQEELCKKEFCKESYRSALPSEAYV